MNIYSSKGTKVRYTGKNGYDSDLHQANDYLIVGEIYTVKKTNVGSFHTSVLLEEVDNQWFNSAHFEMVKGVD